MNKLTKLMMLLAIMAVVSCNSAVEEKVQSIAEPQAVEESPREMLVQAYQLFKEGNDTGSVRLANRVLEIGRETKNDTLIGRALTSLCRNSQRSLDTTRLAELSVELADLAATSGDQKWLMYRAHMNAEMWRLIGDMDRAESFYNESMRISFETNSMGMYTVDHFNKSFVSVAKGDFKTAKQLLVKYYELRRAENNEMEDAIGLIALAYYLEQQKNYKGAHEVAVVARRLFKEQNLFPEPPDEKPLLAVELKVQQELKPAVYDEISMQAEQKTVADLLGNYLK
jgi:tetratricopeptide (TPR) repeat protein